MAFTRTFMQLRPIIAALGRHKVATALIVLQVALTLAVASNWLLPRAAPESMLAGLGQVTVGVAC